MSPYKFSLLVSKSLSLEVSQEAVTMNDEQIQIVNGPNHPRALEVDSETRRLRDLATASLSDLATASLSDSETQRLRDCLSDSGTDLELDAALESVVKSIDQTAIDLITAADAIAELARDSATPRLRDCLSDSETQRLSDSETAFTETAFVSIIMPVRNEARYISETLMQLVGQDYPADRYEILVADGMSDDDTREIVVGLSRQYPQIRLLDNLERRSGAGRNVGFRASRGEYVLVVDGHCHIPDDQLFRSVVDCFQTSNADCLGRPQPLDAPGLSRFQRGIAVARSSWLGHGGDSLIFGQYEGFASPVSNGAAYRRDVFEKIGYVDEAFDAAEDVEFNYRVEKAGLTAYTSPRLTVRYHPRESFKGLFRQMQRYGMGRCRFIKKHREALTINQLVPALFVCGLFVLLLSFFKPLVPGTWLPVFMLWALYNLYALILLGESARLSSKKGWTFFPLLPLIFVTIHTGIGWGFVRQLFKGENVASRNGSVADRPIHS